MQSKEEKDALALVFGVKKRDAMLSGIPGFVPGLAQKLACYGCKVRLSRGLPVEFAEYMTDEQKSQFKSIMKRYKKKAVKAVPSDTVSSVLEEKKSEE